MGVTGLGLVDSESSGSSFYSIISTALLAYALIYLQTMNKMPTQQQTVHRGIRMVAARVELPSI